MSQNPYEKKFPNIGNFTLRQIQNIGMNALVASHHIWQALGETGLEDVHKNQFGDKALKADIEAEAAVLQVLSDSHLPVEVHSEEHGIVPLPILNGLAPGFLAVLDGIDGSHWFKKDIWNGKYCTLLGIFAGNNPLYGDALFSGMMEHTTGSILYATRHSGAFRLDVATGVKVPIQTSRAKVFDRRTLIQVDEYWPTNQNVFLKHLDRYNVLPYNFCSSVHYSRLAMGDADLALECTRKGNLEIAAVFALMMELGAAMMSLDGRQLSEQRYRTFGQGKDEHIPIVTAATPELARAALAFFAKHSADAAE